MVNIVSALKRLPKDYGINGFPLPASLPGTPIYSVSFWQTPLLTNASTIIKSYNYGKHKIKWSMRSSGNPNLIQTECQTFRTSSNYRARDAYEILKASWDEDKLQCFEFKIRFTKY